MTPIDLRKSSSQLPGKLKPSSKRLYHTVAPGGAQATVTENSKRIASVSSESGSSHTRGRLLAIDLGTRRVGVALSDEMQMTVRPLAGIERKSWKNFLGRVTALIETWKPCGLVIGLPLSLDGAERSAAKETRTIAERFQRSLGVPIYLQDERLTTFAAESEMKSRGRSEPEIKREVDSEAAAIILRDFIEAREHD